MSAIVHIVQRMAPGGIETLVLDLAEADGDVRVLSLEGVRAGLIAEWPRLAALGERFDALAKAPGLSPRLIATVARRLRREKAAAVVAHHMGPLVYGGLAARLARIPVRVYVEHDGWHYCAPARARLGRLLDVLVQPRRVAVSRGTAAAAARALDSDLVEIIPNGVDLRRFCPRDLTEARRALGLPESGVIIGSVGRLQHVKGHDVLIEAFASLAPAARLALVGDGPEMQALKDRVAALGLEGRVDFLGHRDGIERVYPAFDLLCQPSRAEGFPRTLIEAQACDVPVVATDVGGAREAVCPLSGRLVPPEDPVRLALALVAAIEHPPSAHPRDFVDPRFSFERTLAAYRSVSSDRRLSLAA